MAIYKKNGSRFTIPSTPFPSSFTIFPSKIRFVTLNNSHKSYRIEHPEIMCSVLILSKSHNFTLSFSNNMNKYGTIFPNTELDIASSFIDPHNIQPPIFCIHGLRSNHLNFDVFASTRHSNSAILRPFSLHIWTWVLVSFLCFLVFILILFHIGKIGQYGSVTLWTVGCCLKQYSLVPYGGKRVQQFSLLWILFTFFILNFYESFFYTELVRLEDPPIPKDFKELVDFNIPVYTISGTVTIKR